jgi:glycosyltransferase involved in cell wall biosynthesis
MTASARRKVTVFVLAYNREANVGDAIDSILAQSFVDFELLLVDDGSEDRSLESIGSRKDPRVRVVSNECNLGIPSTCNRGLELARGEYIALLDSNDRADHDRLLPNPPAPIYCGFR